MRRMEDEECGRRSVAAEKVKVADPSQEGGAEGEVVEVDWKR